MTKVWNDEPLIIKATVLGNCGVIHNSIEEWQQCSACEHLPPRRALSDFTRVVEETGVLVQGRPQKEAYMTHLEALKHIRTLINVASESDDIDFIYKHLRMMRNVVNKAVPAPTLRQRAAAKKKAAKKPALRVVK